MSNSSWRKLLSSMTILSLLSAGSNSCARGKLGDQKRSEDSGTKLTKFTKEKSELIEGLRSKGIASDKVLNAMEKIPRHVFVPDSLKNMSYDDNALPIGLHQTISQPYIVAYMTESLDLKPEDKVLEVGTGSGYQAAVLSKLVNKVYSIELLEPLARQARETLKGLDIDNVEIMTGDGYKGWPEKAPFNAIIITAAPPEVPKVLLEQLKDGGRLIVPVGQGDVQWLVLITREKDKFKQRQLIPVRFVPMVHGESKN